MYFPGDAKLNHDEIPQELIDGNFDSKKMMYVHDVGSKQLFGIQVLLTFPDFPDHSGLFCQIRCFPPVTHTSLLGHTL